MSGQPGTSDSVLDLVRAGGLLPPGRPVVVMLSGGRDSVCLLDVAVGLAGTGAVHALHLNYGLRPAAGDEESHCRDLCLSLDVALTVERAEAREPGNLQAWARELRYAAARRLAAERGARIAVAHTASDQAETVLYRLAASPGRRALLGMAAQDGELIRPLLSLTRDQTAAHCQARGLAWREDESNLDDRYARARVRGQLLGALRSIHPAAEANVVRTAELLRDEAEVLDRVVADVLQGAAGVEVARLRELPVPLARLVSRRLAEEAAGRLVPAAARRVEEIIALGAGGGSASLDLGGGCRAIVEYGHLRFSARPPPRPPAAVSISVPGTARFGGYEVTSRAGPPERRDGVLAAEALGSSLVVRGWRPGDRMSPMGAGGRRSLQDLFTDRRVPQELRHELPVIESDGEIAWVPGVAVGERFRVTDRTREAVHLDARRLD